jgi:ribosomal-protein-alanine N-acetyltransferase
VICRSCRYQTERLQVNEWHAPEHARTDLPAMVIDLLTPAVTDALPDAWKGTYSPDRAGQWIAERDQEGTTLLVVERDSDRTIGVVILFEQMVDNDPDHVAVRLGYLLDQSSWGQGYATELIEGFVAWCRRQASLRSITGGVDELNVASARVLTRNGFVAVACGGGSDEQLYELDLRD